MSKNEKFDFSREEDQKRFEQLPAKEQAKEIASAQQQFNFMLQKVQSGEVRDYDEAEEEYETKDQMKNYNFKHLIREIDQKNKKKEKVEIFLEQKRIRSLSEEERKKEIDNAHEQASYLKQIVDGGIVGSYDQAGDYYDDEDGYGKDVKMLFDEFLWSSVKEAIDFAKKNKLESQLKHAFSNALSHFLYGYNARSAQYLVDSFREEGYDFDLSSEYFRDAYVGALYRCLDKEDEKVNEFFEFIKKNNINIDLDSMLQEVLNYKLKGGWISTNSESEMKKVEKILGMMGKDKEGRSLEIFHENLKEYIFNCKPYLFDDVVTSMKNGGIEFDWNRVAISVDEKMDNYYPKGMDMDKFFDLYDFPEVGLDLVQSIHDLTTFSFKNQIQPIINSQGVGAHLYFENIKKMDYKNLSNDDIEYITLVAKKYGTQARNILENILVKIGPEKIAEEKENIENFIQEIKIIDFDLFQEYQEIKNNPEKKKELKENVNILQNKVYKGETSEEDFENNLYSAVSYHTFPPAIGITKDQYEQLNETRPDRRNDVPKILDDLQYQKFQVPTGKYTIGEDEELNMEKWQAIGNAIKKVNEEKKEEPKINEIEVGQKLIEMYQKKTTEEKSNQEFLFENMYRYHLQKGGGKLESGFQISIQGLMQYKEFVGDRIKNDLIKDVLTKWKEQNPKEFEKLKADTMNRLKASQAQNFAKVKNMLNAIQKQNDETKKQKAIENLDEFLKHFQMSYDQIKGKNIDELARHIEATKVDYEGELTEENYQTEEYYNSDSFIKAYDEFTEKKDQDKLVFQKISSDLIAETNKKMRKEVDKFKFETDEGGSETKELEFAISKKKEHGVVGYNTGVCVAPDEQLWNDETFSNCIMFDPELKQAMGGMHFLIRENNLCLPGINPSLEILSQVENEKLFDQMMEYAKKVKDKLNLEKVLIPTNTSICSNRNQIQEILRKKNYPTIDLKQTADFSYSPYKYSFQKCFVVK